MSGRNSLNSVPEINFAGKISNMTDAQYKSYLQDLNAFVDGFPAKAAKLREDLANKKFGDLTRSLFSVCDTLAKIHANDLALEYRGKINRLRHGDHDEVEAFTERFILDISSLSIDIQMAAHKSRQSAPPRTARSFGKGKARVLAVDNAVMFLNTLTRLLEDTPYELHCITSANEALQYLERNQPDVILLDIEMPEMNGYELARKIKQRGLTAPIIFITANSARESVDKAIEVGAAGLLMKPLRLNQLLAKLKEFA